MKRKTVVITGCSSGFGRSTALELARHGWQVFATVRREEDLVNLLKAAEIQGSKQNIRPLLCDITNEEQVRKMMQEVQEVLCDEIHKMGSSPMRTFIPGLDALINNAGTGYPGPIELLPLDDLRIQLEVNLVAQVGVTQAFLSMLKVSRGMILNISSIQGQIAMPGMGAYAASKFALEGLSDALRLELAPFGVRVIVIEPQGSSTSIWKTSLQQSMKYLDPHLENSPYSHLLQVLIAKASRSAQEAEQVKKTRFPPERLANLIVQILSRRKPRTRYRVPGLVTIAIFMRRLLPDLVWDRLICWMMHF